MNFSNPTSHLQSKLPRFNHHHQQQQQSQQTLSRTTRRSSQNRDDGGGNDQHDAQFAVSSSNSIVTLMPTKRQRIRLDSNNANNTDKLVANKNQKWHNHIKRHNQQAGNSNNSYQRKQQNGQRSKLIDQDFPGYRQDNNNKIITTNASSSKTSNNNQNGFYTPVQTRSAELSDIPGFSYDPVTRKYYKILDDRPGQPSGSTLHHLRNLAVNTAAVNELQKAKKCFNAKKAGKVDLPNLLSRLQLSGGGPNAHYRNIRNIEESRLKNMTIMPSYSFEVIDTYSQRFDSCQFLDVSEDGRTMLGCWSTQRHDLFAAHCSQVLSFNVNVNKECAEKDSRHFEENPQHLFNSNGRYKCNTYGLHFEPLDNGICLETSHQVLVDMVLAPADRDVTCLLFATASSYYKTASDGACPRIITKCKVNLQPIEFNLSEEGRESMSSPIYNAQWTFNEPIWSLCFNSHHMKICIGMEKCARILNVLNGERSENFFVSSGGKNVISCNFSKDGNSLLLGRKNADISLLDLRMNVNHYIGELRGSTSTGFMYLMRDRPNTLLSENFEGKIKLWDLRMQRELSMLQAGHRNSSHKLPCFVDNNERFFFAVGEDAVVRGWSLHTGELICAVNSPRAYIQEKAHYQQQLLMGNANGVTRITDAKIDFPRVAYSSCWGGRVGNSALVFAVNGDVLVHELLL